MTQEPIPLTYKLHDLEHNIRMTGQGDDAEEGIPNMRRLFTNINEPLGPLEELPFEVERTHKGNLPVYTDIRSGGNRQVTVVRKVTGDIDAFRTELSKVVSNSPINDKMGRLEVNGIHSQKVKLWLTRLGF